ncbi:hypothetical protein CDD83_6036 [Cordyceps sp. RAO-2017]|nr:hypothetical protein CDD83_6036 [Cordyceps sp. RAO-2017]
MASSPGSVTSNPSVAHLVHLLQGINKYVHELGGLNDKQGHRHPEAAHGTFYPKFDVRELKDAFELYGELAGVQKKDIIIEFSEPQTLVVRGFIERCYSTAKPAEQTAPGSSATPSTKDTDQGKQTPLTTAEKIPSPGARERDRARYWASERSIGEFSRIFIFPERVQQSGVTALLDGGILRVHIPKATKDETHGHRIEVD